MQTQEVILNAVSKLVGTVKQTLGAKGRTVLFNTEENKPYITKDGVTVARHIASECNYENMAMTVLRESSVKTMMSAGDGTTSTLIIAEAIIKAGYELMNNGISYYDLSKALDKAAEMLINNIRMMALPAEENPEVLKHVASIAANDEYVGEYIYSIIQEIGIYGHIEVKASYQSETKVVKTKGMRLHRGWFEGFMVNDTKEMTFTAHDSYVLIFNDTIRTMKDIISYIEYAIVNQGSSLVIFCNDISDITLKQIKFFMEATPSPICFVENDGTGDRREILLNDLAALTNGYIIDHDNDFDITNLGKAATVKIDELYTSVTASDPDNELIKAIVDDIKYRIALNDSNDDLYLSPVEKKWYKKRLANLTGGVAVIHAGGSTEMEMKELKDRLDDAVLAVYSAIRDGVCIGGGYTYLHAQKALIGSNKLENVLYNAIVEPFKQLLINADLFKEHDKIKKKILSGYGYDLRNNKFMKEEDYKVYDSAGVLIDSVNNAIAASKSLLSVKSMVFDGIIHN